MNPNLKIDDFEKIPIEEIKIMYNNLLQAYEVLFFIIRIN